MTTDLPWTAIRALQPQYFHMVANGYALFTQVPSEAFRCENESSAQGLCEALEETDPSGWKPTRITDPDNSSSTNQRKSE